ncbi:hypothetical protein SAMN06297144_1881 [Sphingomonas guangdongensis]|uniref:Uncharacterized protein n=1 Tax=Sphingomonas guangdongensis TaxID=1141890 RepID=A0A285R351_9SPHN|nr:hypothetical protein [Sphingomonas guangdongensis]SOB86772.1 hypothetical protein SAMN06297144_1881 [Sphingomonas guangdongensis]
MRPGLNTPIGSTGTTYRDALSGHEITTALVARFDFASETLCAWTGPETIQPQMTGDTLLDNQVIHPLVNGLVVNVGDNVMSYTGSDELPITLALPDAPDETLIAAQVYPSEYRGRRATIWSAILIRTGNPLEAPIWAFRRVRTGAMDKLQINRDASQHTLTLTIESHAGLIAGSGQSTYMSQQLIDPLDRSQAHAATLAAGNKVPSYGGGSGGTYNDGGGRLNQDMPLQNNW